MIKERTVTTRKKEKGITQEHIYICTRHCPFPARKCNGNCDFYKKEAKRIRETKQLKKNIIVF